MFKTIGIAALASIVALVLGFGALGTSTPAAHAETTDVVVVACENFAGAVDGVKTDTTTDADVQAACGGLNALGVPQNLPATAAAGSPSVKNLANAIGDEDGVLEASDFRGTTDGGEFNEDWDQNQISTDCTRAGRTYVTSLGPPVTGDLVNGLACTLAVFVFVNDEGATKIDLPSGVATVENTNLDFTCTRDATRPTSAFSVTGVVGTVFTTALAHSLLVGDTINIAAPIEGVPAGDYMVATVPSATTFTLTGVAVGPSIPYVSGAKALTSVTAANPGVWTTAAWPFVAGSQFTLNATVPGSVPVIAAGTYTVAAVNTATTQFNTGLAVTTAGGASTITPIFTISLLDKNIRADNDCADGTDALLGGDTNGDGVVLFHVLVDTVGASAGDTKTVFVSQEAVEQDFDINVVGPANDVKLKLVESLIETNATTANVTACRGTEPLSGAGATGVGDADAVLAPTSTVAWAVVTDKDDTPLTRVPVIFKITPPEGTEIARIGVGSIDTDLDETVTGNTYFTLQPENTALPTAAYAVICGGKQTGEATIDAAINVISCSLTACTILSSQDHSSADITVGGAPSTNVLTAEASTIKCDGSEKSTVTAKVTDSNGDNVADGVPVNFSVVALGTANPINTVTKDGVATSVITPLSNSSAGVTVIVSAGDSDIKSVVQTSVRVDCALPLNTQAPPAAPTPRGGIAGPDTGSGGYLGQSDSSSFPAWALIALALGSVTLVAGGLVTRRAGK